MAAMAGLAVAASCLKLSVLWGMFVPTGPPGAFARSRSVARYTPCLLVRLR